MGASVKDYEPRWTFEAIFWNLVVFVLMLCIPFGIGMALYMDDIIWLWFCVTLILFLS
jgi:hypothetical protein